MQGPTCAGVFAPVQLSDDRAASDHGPITAHQPAAAMATGGEHARRTSGIPLPAGRPAGESATTNSMAEDSLLDGLLDPPPPVAGGEPSETRSAIPERPRASPAAPSTPSPAGTEHAGFGAADQVSVATGPPTACGGDAACNGAIQACADPAAEAPGPGESARLLGLPPVYSTLPASLPASLRHSKGREDSSAAQQNNALALPAAPPAHSAELARATSGEKPGTDSVGAWSLAS